MTSEPIILPARAHGQLVLYLVAGLVICVASFGLLLLHAIGIPVTRSNCVLQAFALWRREGGYVVCSASRYGWWPHVRHTIDFQTFTEFTTDHKTARWCPPPAFPGYLRCLTVTMVRAEDAASRSQKESPCLI